MKRQLPATGRWGFLGRTALYAVGLSCLFLALARPQWGFHYEESTLRGSELVLVVDVSQSMMAEDIHPNRLALARRALYDLSEAVEGDAVGIVAFAGVPFLLCPPTPDSDALRLFIDMLDPALIPVQGTNLAGAIALALESFNEKTSVANRALVLITDGEDHGARLNAAVESAKDKGIRIFVVGLGSPQGAPIPLAEGGGFKQDEGGAIVLSKFNEQVLADIAQKTGGSFIRNKGDHLDLAGLYRRAIRGELGEGETGSRQKRVYHERFEWPLAIGLVCFFLASLRLPHWRRKSALALVLGIAELAFAAGARAQALAENTPPELLYNQGNDHYEAKAYLEAQRAYEEVLSRWGLGSQQGKETLFNLGNAFYRAGALDRALEVYEKLLAVDPNHRPAQLNRDFVKNQSNEKQKSDRDSASDEGGQAQEGGQSSDAKEKTEAKDTKGGQGQSQDAKTGQDEGTPSGPQGEKPVDPKEAKREDTKTRAERWLEAVPENGQEILKREVRTQIPRQTVPEKDW